MEWLRADAWIKPNEASRKVYILCETQYMTAWAQNALLKLLEEPPAGVLFVLTCDNRFKLLETVRSRVVNLKELRPDLTIAAMAEQMEEAFQRVYGLKAERLSEQAFDTRRIEALAERNAGWDWLYGREDPALIGRPALHSCGLTMAHPVTGEVLRLAAPMPEDMARLIREKAL